MSGVAQQHGLVSRGIRQVPANDLSQYRAVTIDWTDPTVQGVVIAAVISLAGVFVAAVAGVFGALGGARIGAKAAQETAKVTQAEGQPIV